MDLTNLNKDRKQPPRRKGNALELSTMMYGKVPPQAKDLEEAILGAILLDKNAFESACEILKTEMFYVEANQRVFRAMANLCQKNSPIDLLTVVEQLRFQEELDLVGGPYYVSKLTNSVVSSANMVAHAKIIAQKFIQRELIRVSGEIICDAFEDSTDAFDLQSRAEQMIMAIGTIFNTGNMVHITQVMVDALKQVEEWKIADSPITGVPFGFSKLDRATRGGQPGDLIILAARPSVGKTAFMLNIARNAAKNPEKPGTVGIWSLEMAPIYLALRMMAAESKILLQKIQTGQMDEAEMKHLYNVCTQSLGKANIYFDDSPAITIKTFQVKARRLKKQAERDGKPLNLIVIDYLQLMSGDSDGGNREQEVSYISRKLKETAKELGITIIALSQLTRGKGVDGVTWKHGPPISSLRESGAIEQDADMIWMLWGATDAEIEERPELDQMRKLRIAKQRNGVVLTVELDFKHEIQFFQQLDSMIPEGFKPVQIDWQPVDHTISKAERLEDDPEQDLPF